MKKKLGVFLIRGAGREGSKEQEKFVAQLNPELQTLGIDPGGIHLEEDVPFFVIASSPATEIISNYVCDRLKRLAEFIKQVME